jgi:hypothetical protein
MILNRPLIIILLLISDLIKAQSTVQDLGVNPIYFIDSVRVTSNEVMKADPTKVTLMTVISREEAFKTFGEEGKDGMVYVETVNFVKRRYWDYFRSKTKDSKSIKKIDTHQNLQFILNEKPLQDIDIGTLHTVNDDTLEEFRIINKKKLKKKYKVRNRDYGIVIKTK